MYSFVIPVLNEEESLAAFYNELSAEVKKLGAKYEIIFVDDGSTDESLSILKELEKKDKYIKIFSFRRNLGKAEALTLGFIKAQGDYIITLDADLQDKPSEISKLLEKSKEGWDIVSGWRKERKDKKNMVWASWLFNNLTGKIFKLRLHDYNCGLKIYTKDAAKSLRLYGGMHRFIPIIASEEGFSVTEIAVSHDIRKYGQSKYHFSKLWKDLPDIFTMFFLIKYSKRPLHFFGVIGGMSFVVGVSILIYLAILHFLGFTIGDRPLLLYGMSLVLGGLQISFTGFLADLLIHVQTSSLSVDQASLNYPLKYDSGTDHKI